MPYRKEQFINDEIYHIVLRAIDDNILFKNTNDYYRGIFSIYEFNTSKSITIQERRKARNNFKKRNSRQNFNYGIEFIDTRNKLVEILVFCFMPNHIHLLLKQIQDNGITKFMSKVGTGYAGYFNRKYQRKGHVFQNRFRSVAIKNDNQLITVANYIHANPISLIEPNFKEQGVKNHSVDEVIEFLKKYRWSSFLDYVGIDNFPSVTEREFLLKIIGGSKGAMNNMTNWVSYKKELSLSANMLLE